jgi:hypothetical protein
MKKQFTLAPIFKDNMMFQSNKPIRIFGECKKGTEIKVSFLEQSIKFKAKSETFLIELKPLEASEEEFSFTVSSKKQIETYNKCLIGDIYLFIGGMNVSQTLKDSPHEDDLVNDKVRILDMENDFEDDFLIWKTAGRESMEESSALAYVFAKQISGQKTPVGVIVCSNEDSTIFSMMCHRDIDSHFDLNKYVKVHNEDDDRLLIACMYENIYRKISPMSLNSIVIYQGENDCKHGNIYASCMSRIITSYRLMFKDEKLAYVVVQSAGYNYPDATDDCIAHIRHSQTCLANDGKKIYIASAIDIGDANNIVLKNKTLIAKRIANVILEKIHNLTKNSISPTYYSYERDVDGIIIYIKNNYSNLKSKSGRSIGFYASKNGVDFEELKTVNIMSDRIIIRRIKDIREIRYAHDKYPVCDVFTTNGLPLLPFKIKLVE